MPVFVLGMHRSGTSAVTRTVNLLGVPLGAAADLMPANAGNPKGYWESSDLRAVNDELLEILGGSWSAPPRLDPGWEQDPRLEPIRHRARAAFETIYTGPEWIWKDPRTSITLPFWMDVARVRPVIVLVHRNPLEIWQSLLTRDGFSKITAFALWERYLRSALENARGLPVFVIPYEGLLRNSRHWCEALATFFDLHGGRPDRSDQTEEIEAFLDRELRHAAFAKQDIENDSILRPEQRRLFDALESAIGGHDAFVPLDIGSESPVTEDVLAERRRLERNSRAEKRRVEEALSAFVDITAESFASAPVPENRKDVSRAPDLLDASQDVGGYRAWLERHKPLADERRAKLSTELAAAPALPSLTVIVALDHAELPRLRRVVDSIISQIYTRWQLLLCNFVVGDPHLDAFLESITAAESRSCVLISTGSTICLASNEALMLAEGEFVCFLGLYDQLAPEALARIALAVAADPTTDLVYSDEDRIDRCGERSAPSLKPDWSPDLLLSEMYLGQLLAIRRSLIAEVGGFRDEFDGARDYDLALRASERARRIVHVPEVLHHRHAEAPAGRDDTAARTALASALERRGEAGTIEAGLVPGTFRVRRRLSSSPKVSVLIPFRDHAELTERCVRSLRLTAGYANWEALLIDNQSWEPETRALLPRLASDPRCRVLVYPQPFNWAEINNWAAARCDGDVLLFLNNDTEGVVDGWMAAMVEHVQRREVGAVGARLVYADGRVQHAGVLLGINGTCGHAFHAFDREQPGYCGFAKVIRDYSAVTGACMMVRREVFEELHGFDRSYAVAYSDVDFCLRLGEMNYLVVYTPFAELIHHECATRGLSLDRSETNAWSQRWLKRIDRDPYFHPSLSRRSYHFSLPATDEP